MSKDAVKRLEALKDNIEPFCVTKDIEVLDYAIECIKNVPLLNDGILERDTIIDKLMTEIEGLPSEDEVEKIIESHMDKISAMKCDTEIDWIKLSRTDLAGVIHERITLKRKG